MKAGCNLREPECQKALHDACGGGPINHRCNACDDVMDKFCNDQQGQQCLDCLGQHVSDLQKGHCNMRQCGRELEEKCNAHPPNAGSCAGCVADVHQYCPLSPNTTIHECEKCIASHIGDFLYQNCDIREYNCGRAIFNACRGHHHTRRPHTSTHRPNGQCNGCMRDFMRDCESSADNHNDCIECIETHFAKWGGDDSCNVVNCLSQLNRMCGH